MKSRQSERTVVTLGNASQLFSHVLQGVVGNEIADSIDGSPLTRTALYTIANAEFNAALDHYLEK